MCGICGIVRPQGVGPGVDSATVIRMRDTMVHRGPDASGIWMGNGVGLGHRRLSIIDIAGGRQPMATADGRYHLVYNGEIYNHPLLMKELEREGVAYRTRSDTETLLLLFARGGTESVHRLRGMFAFGVWDQGENRLVLARDRLGIKPLYYSHLADGSLVFGSEIKAIAASGLVEVALNHHALPDYLANHATSGEETLFSGIKRLLPGHILTWQDGQVRVERYWRLSFEKQERPRGEEELIEEFSERFRESVRLRLMSDVPLGAFLSGGIDSTAITAMMSEMVDEPIRTFSVAFAEREANELEFARIVSKAYGTRHREVVVSPDRFFSIMPRMVWHEDEPIAHPSSIALYEVAALSAEDVKVVLTGEGSDELLAGYARYWKTLANLRFGRLYNKLTPPPLRSRIQQGVGWLARHSAFGRKLRRTPLAMTCDLRSLYLENFSVFSSSRQDRLFTEQTSELLGPSDPYRTLQALMDESPASDLLDILLSVDLQAYLVELLMKQDQMSMAASIESRVPFLDHELVEFAGSLPIGMKIKGRTTKYILRKSMEGRLPPAILKRPKAGFPVPISKWFRGRYSGVVEEFVLSERARSRGLFDPEELKRLCAEHSTGGDDHGQRLWSLINLEVWHRINVDAEPIEAIGGLVSRVCG
ncbi:MAG: asparagine synthase (glutamine-hydrolyzing) [Gemmatimonadetes bacterium]|nr:asparagine synthase (glutamine-hydrolyzing) [Gemmatimonadota bacterium]NNM04257.1 asparagine synthase (glutamine-hydrolyzing) [Gemmatimonadota bacterium]